MNDFMRSMERLLEEDAEFRAGYDDAVERERMIATLVEWRDRAGMSQKQVAKAMGVGQSTISQFEGSTDPRLSTVQRYARAVGAKAHFLVGSTPSPAQANWHVTAPTQPSRRVWEGDTASTTTRVGNSRSAFAKAA